MSEQGQRARASTLLLPDPVRSTNVVHNPSLDTLRAMARDDETTTGFGAPAYVSEHRSRNADRTRNARDDEFGPADVEHLETAVAAARSREMVCLDRRLGRHPEHSYVCRLFVPQEFARIALAWGKLFEPVEGRVEEPDFVTFQVPDHDEVAIRVFPEEGLTAVLGSDYTGEAKKSFLRLFMYRVKQAGGLGLHAGSKRVCLEAESGDLDEVGQVFLGLSATGKSTLTAHGLWLDEPESAAMLQDDVCALLPDGTVAGSEGGGLYVKTMGLDPDEQPALHDAVTHDSAVLENVDVGPEGSVDFDSDRYTSNGRAVIERARLDSAADDIDLGEIDQLFFITRNPLMPPVARLSDAQAAAAFMLGESIETSAGDPSKAGESIRVVGTNPFIVGPEGAEGNRFRELIRDLDVDCFVLNTGEVGHDGRDVGVRETVTILRELARGRVTWRTDDATGLTVPDDVPGLDIDVYDVAANVEDLETRLRELRDERRLHLAQFPALDEEIRDAVY